MRTTITVDDDLLRRARVVAARSGRTLSQVVEDALRARLAGQDSAEPPAAAPYLPVSSVGTGLLPGVRLEPKHELWALLDDEGERQR